MTGWIIWIGAFSGFNTIITCHDLSDSDYTVTDADYSVLVGLLEPND